VLVHAELEHQGVDVSCQTQVKAIAKNQEGSGSHLTVRAIGPNGAPLRVAADVVLVVVGVRPDTALAASAGAKLGTKGAIVVDREMRTSLPDVFAAGDCVETYHRILGTTYLPLGTTAHKQGRIAGENALGRSRQFAGSLGTQVVKVFDLVAARTGLRDPEAVTAGCDPLSVTARADDHKAYYPGSRPITMRYTGDRRTGQLLGVQLVGHRHAEIAKRIDIPATAIFNDMTIEAVSDLDLSYTPPLGSPWDALQTGAQMWIRHALRVSDGRQATGQGQPAVGR
jgi:NADPH-dependent 2,4-dienoyl-CoA reductase/sulfur reductase-like enzyme